MKSKHKQREVLRRYLLGQLSEGQRSEVAEQYFVDEEFFDDLLDMEEELLDQYVRGQLSAKERSQFGEYLGALPDASIKLATAYALKEVASESQEHSPASSVLIAPSSSLSFWESVRNRLPGRGLVPQYALAAIVIVLVASLAYLIVIQQRLRRDVERLRADQSQAEREKTSLAAQAQTSQQQHTAQRERILQLEQELAEARQQQNQNDAERVASKTTATVLASLILTPALRSGGVADSLTLSPDMKAVMLIVPLSQAEIIASYKAVLQTTEGKRVLAQDRLRLQSSSGGHVVKLRVSAARLANESYKLTLQGKAADGIEIAQDYYFNVIRK